MALSPPVRRRLFAAAAVASVGICLAVSAPHDAVPAAGGAAAQGLTLEQFSGYCLPVPAEAKVISSVVPERRFDETVPLVNPPLSAQMEARSATVFKGETVEFKVSSPRDGALAVHGLSDLMLIHANETTTVRFRAIYSGRFAMHFHGTDGSHFEIAALKILPR